MVRTDGAERSGPCACPTCLSPDTDGGQWSFIPHAFVGELREGHSGCLCKRKRCRAHFGLPPYGRKRPALSEPGLPVVAAVAQAPARPYMLRRIDQVWGMRCASAARPCACGRALSTLCPARPLARRCADLDCMSEEERENKLEHQESEIEYLVHGQWNRSEIDANGRFGAWWADVHYILSSGVNETDLKSALDFFEEKQHSMRNAAIADVKQRIEAQQQ